MEGSPIVRILPFGDSKSTENCYLYPLLCAPLFLRVPGPWREEPPRIAAGGTTVHYWAANIDASLATVDAGHQAPDFILSSLMSNDESEVKATWKTNYAYCLDALHAKFSTTPVYVARCWKRAWADYPHWTAMNDEWIPEIIADGRSAWMHLGVDERTYLPGPDENGNDYTSDGTHPTGYGYALTARAWRDLLGL